jgi:two-component system, OmpR family, sensor kinase
MSQSDVPLPVGGLALLCNPNGTLRTLLRDDVGLGAAFVPGRAFTSLLDPGSFHKGLTFFATLRAHQVVDDWELQIRLENKPHTMHVLGRVTPEGLLIVATPWRQHLARLCAEVVETAEELTAASRLRVREDSRAGGQAAVPADALYEDFTRVYNDFATLQREVARQNAELQRLHTEMHRLLGMVAHDLRNPLATIQLLSDCLRESAGDRLEPDEVGIIEEIEQASTTMRRLIEDLLDISKVEASGLDIVRAPTDLVALVQATVALNRPLAKRKHIQVVVETDQPRVMVDIDAERIRQVLNNLFSNAVKYSMPATNIRITLACETSTAVVSVIDEGQGIPPEELPRLFHAFSRTSVQPTAGEPSTGLGLAICKKIIGAHGGKIWAESAPGRGSTFRFTVPRPAA